MPLWFSRPLPHEQNKRKQGVMDLDSVVPTQEALFGGIHVWRLHDHVEQLAAVRYDWCAYYAGILCWPLGRDPHLEKISVVSSLIWCSGSTWKLEAMNKRKYGHK